MLLAAGWALAGFLVVVVAGRVSRLDERWWPPFVLSSITPWLFLPAYPLAAGAAVAGEWGLAAVAATLAVAHAAWVWPDVQSRRAPVASASTRGQAGAVFRVAAVNGLVVNKHPEEMGRALLALDADVLAVVELTPRMARGLRDAGVFDAYPHRVLDPQVRGYGGGIFTRLPMRSAGWVGAGGFPQVAVTVEVDGRPVQVVAIHTRQPLADLPLLQRQLDELREHAVASTVPVVLAGDFNATRHNRGFRRLVAEPLRDAHLATGRALALSWPVGSFVPPFGLLDHVVVTDDVRVHEVVEQAVPGSDHKAVMATLSLD